MDTFFSENKISRCHDRGTRHGDLKWLINHEQEQTQGCQLTPILRILFPFSNWLPPTQILQLTPISGSSRKLLVYVDVGFDITWISVYWANQRACSKLVTPRSQSRFPFCLSQNTLTRQKKLAFIYSKAKVYDQTSRGKHFQDQKFLVHWMW